MIIVLISLILIISCLLSPKNKFLFYIGLIWIFILVGFSSGLADDHIYILRYNNYQVYASQSEPGWNFLVNLLTTNGVSYEGFVIVVGLIYTISILLCIKLTKIKNINIPMSIMMIYPLVLDATQKRQTIAMCISWFAIIALFNYIQKKEKKYLFLYFSIILIAISFHFSVAVYLLLVLVIFKDNKKIAFSRICLFIILLLFSPYFVVDIVSQYIPALSFVVNRVFAKSSIAYSMHSTIMTIGKMVIIFLMYYVPMFFFRKKYIVNDFQKFVLNVNYILLATIPLLLYSNDFYRLQQVVVILDYCAIAQMQIMGKNKNKMTKNGLLVNCFVIVFAFISLYLLVLGNNNIHTVFEPFIYNNRFFR